MDNSERPARQISAEALLRNVVPLVVVEMLGFGLDMASNMISSYLPSAPRWVQGLLFWPGLIFIILPIPSWLLWRILGFFQLKLRTEVCLIVACWVIPIFIYHSNILDTLDRWSSIPVFSGILKGATYMPPTISQWQIGSSGPLFKATFEGTMFSDATGLMQFKIEKINGEAKISTKVTDKNGHQIADILKNEWNLGLTPKAWDRNYNKDSLEVKNEDGDIVLQIRVLSDRVQIQGEWWSNSTHGLRIVQDPNAGGWFCQFTPELPQQYARCPKIIPIFLYPGNLHLGELAQYVTR